MSRPNRAGLRQGRSACMQGDPPSSQPERAPAAAAPSRLLARMLGRPSLGVVALSLFLAVAVVAAFVIDLRIRYRIAAEDGARAAHNYALILAEHTARAFEAIDRVMGQAAGIRDDALEGRLSGPDQVHDALR